MGNQKIKIKTLLLVTTLLAALSFKANAATAPDITYRSGTASPYSSAKVEYTTAGTYNWTVPTGVTEVKITAVGGGGGGYFLEGRWGLVAGSGGTVVENTTLAVSPGTVLTVTVGGGGNGAATGGTSSVSRSGSLIINAPGGTYGTGASGSVFVSPGLIYGAGASSGSGSGAGSRTTIYTDDRYGGPLIRLSGVRSFTSNSSYNGGSGRYGSGGEGKQFILGAVYGPAPGAPATFNIAIGGAGGSWGNGATVSNVAVGTSLAGPFYTPTCSAPTVGGGHVYGQGATGAVFINYIVDTTVSVTGVSLNQSSLSLTPGATSTLTATVSPSNATNKAVTWSSSNTAVATVNNGTVTAVSNGTATITATTASGGYKASCTVTVTTPVTGISVAPTTASLNPGGSQQLAATISPATATNKTYTWASSNTGVATINASGLVTAVANGTATITATTADGGKKASCTVSVTTPTSGVTISPTTTTIIKGKTQLLTATVAPATASDKSLTWTSSNTGVATVNSSGLVTGVGVGSATITATTANGGHKATCAVTVRVPVSGISVSPTTTTLIKGRTQQLAATVTPTDATNKNYTWSSTNTTVATVSATGLVTAVGGGSATISVTTADGSYSASCVVTVTVPVTGINIADVSSTVNTGSTAQLAYTITPSDATNKTVTWSSSNPSVATINATTGVITPVAAGGAEITATTADGSFTDTCFVIVTNNLKPLKIKINTESGKYPGFATVFYKSTGSLITYPGCPVDGSGIITCDVPVSFGNYKIGVSLLNSLIAGTTVNESADDITATPLQLIEGDFNADNIINGTDFTILNQRINYSGGETKYGKVGDINYDGNVNRLDQIIFNSPISFNGAGRFLTAGYEMDISSNSLSRKTSMLAAKTMLADFGRMAETSAAPTEDDHLAPPAKSILEISDRQNGRYEVSFNQNTPKISMFQLALEGDVSNLTYALPEGFQLIGQNIGECETILAIGTMEKGGRIIPAKTAIIAFEAPSMPSIKYGDNNTTMQLAEADGIHTLSFEASSEAANTHTSGGGGCNAGLPSVILLLAPLFYKKKNKKED